MKNISPAVRISFGLTMFTLSVILIADLLGVVPKKDVIELEARKKICESLAVQLSLAASISEFDLVNSSLEIFVDRNEDVIAASMTTVAGNVVAQFGMFENFSEKLSQEAVSNEYSVVVPVFSGNERWGSVNVEFKSIYSSSVTALFTDSILGILVVVTVACFLGYMFILKKSLSVLDPKSVVPDRVRSAFNTLAEGVMILDDKEQIIMANDAFTDKVKQNQDELLGAKLSTMKWRHKSRDAQRSNEKMPWLHSIDDGKTNRGVALNLATNGVGIRAFSTNSAPIQDDKGNIRGALVTFDDITDIEETNIQLENAVTTLKDNEAEIEQKNKELEILATRDPLTGCYNRRAFFDLFEISLAECKDAMKPMTAIMLDIDFFKSVNDRFGHSVGDEVIRLISDVLNKQCSLDNVIVGRYGGEEFCIALPGIELEEAAIEAERIRQIIQKTSTGFCAENMYITASFGVTKIMESDVDCSQILDRADKALYVAKESGRNKVVRWEEHDVVGNASDTVEIDTNKSKDESSGSNGGIDTANVALLQRRIDELEDMVIKYKDENGQDKESNFDSITNLPTKVILRDRIEQAIAYAKRTENIMSIAVLNIDMFSRINDTMGKEVGEEFLRAVGYRLKEILRRSDTVASMMSPGQAGPTFSRLRDDEFALVLSGLEDIESLTYVIRRIQENFSGKISLSGNEIYVTTSIGLSVYPQDGSDPGMLIENARRAQKQAKNQSGRNNFQFYSVGDNRKIIDQMQIELDMYSAIDDNQFQLLYQPKMEFSTGLVKTVEALIRWNRPDQCVVGPYEFIPLAEKTGLIVNIGKWCMHEACIQTKQWVDMGASDVRTAVNVSAIEISEPGFNEYVFSVLKETGLDARHLEIELTESAFMEDPETIGGYIDDLRYMGVTVTLDDFGTGYSSLSYFGRLNLDWLKLDRSFLLEAMSTKRASTMYASIVRMAHDTGVKVVSEGIETHEQYSYIDNLGVDVLQGYILSKPVDSEEMSKILFAEEQHKICAIN